MTSPSAVGRRLAPAAVLGAAGAVVLAVGGLALSRPDVVAVALPIALWSTLILGRRSGEPGVTIALRALTDHDGRLRDEIAVDADAEAVQLLVTQSARRTIPVFVPGIATITSDSRIRHSGPVDTLRVQARELDADGAILGPTTRDTVLTRAVAPARRPLPSLPVAPRLTGLHGAHEGSRPGRGGDFRDIHAFMPGDELRRVDWRATARAARRPGELLVRRTNALSDASVVIVMDTADDLGEVVHTWGSGDLERSGVTSLDMGREAALSIAAATVEAGDRIAFHTLTHGGRSVRSGSGSRHLARIASAISTTGQAGDDARYRRTPPVPQGSMIYVLSTFFDGAAAELALMWRVTGHRVVALDTLPALDRARLTAQQHLALRIVLAERQDMFRELATAGVERVVWREQPDEALSALARAGRVTR